MAVTKQPTPTHTYTVTTAKGETVERTGYAGGGYSERLVSPAAKAASQASTVPSSGGGSKGSTQTPAPFVGGSGLSISASAGTPTTGASAPAPISYGTLGVQSQSPTGGSLTYTYVPGVASTKAADTAFLKYEAAGIKPQVTTVTRADPNDPTKTITLTRETYDTGRGTKEIFDRDPAGNVVARVNIGGGTMFKEGYKFSPEAGVSTTTASAEQVQKLAAANIPVAPVTEIPGAVKIAGVPTGTGAGGVSQSNFMWDLLGGVSNDAGRFYMSMKEDELKKTTADARARNLGMSIADYNLRVAKSGPTLFTSTTEAKNLANQYSGIQARLDTSPSFQRTQGGYGTSTAFPATTVAAMPGVTRGFTIQQIGADLQALGSKVAGTIMAPAVSVNKMLGLTKQPEPTPAIKLSPIPPPTTAQLTEIFAKLKKTPGYTMPTGAGGQPVFTATELIGQGTMRVGPTGQPYNPNDPLGLGLQGALPTPPSPIEQIQQSAQGPVGRTVGEAAGVVGRFIGDVSTSASESIGVPLRIFSTEAAGGRRGEDISREHMEVLRSELGPTGQWWPGGLVTGFGTAYTQIQKQREDAESIAKKSSDLQTQFKLMTDAKMMQNDADNFNKATKDFNERVKALADTDKKLSEELSKYPKDEFGVPQVPADRNEYYQKLINGMLEQKEKLDSEGASLAVQLGLLKNKASSVQQEFESQKDLILSNRPMYMIAREDFTGSKALFEGTGILVNAADTAAKFALLSPAFARLELAIGALGTGGKIAAGVGAAGLGLMDIGGRTVGFSKMYKESGESPLRGGLVGFGMGVGETAGAFIGGSQFRLSPIQYERTLLQPAAAEAGESQIIRGLSVKVPFTNWQKEIFTWGPGTGKLGFQFGKVDLNANDIKLAADVMDIYKNSQGLRSNEFLTNKIYEDLLSKGTIQADVENYNALKRLVIEMQSANKGGYYDMLFSSPLSNPKEVTAMKGLPAPLQDAIVGEIQLRGEKSLGWRGFFNILAGKGPTVYKGSASFSDVLERMGVGRPKTAAEIPGGETGYGSKIGYQDLDIQSMQKIKADNAKWESNLNEVLKSNGLDKEWKVRFDEGMLLVEKVNPKTGKVVETRGVVDTHGVDIPNPEELGSRKFGLPDVDPVRRVLIGKEVSAQSPIQSFIDKAEAVTALRQRSASDTVSRFITEPDPRRAKDVADTLRLASALDTSTPNYERYLKQVFETSKVKYPESAADFDNIFKQFLDAKAAGKRLAIPEEILKMPGPSVTPAVSGSGASAAMAWKPFIEYTDKEGNMYTIENNPKAIEKFLKNLDAGVAQPNIIVEGGAFTKIGTVEPKGGFGETTSTKEAEAWLKKQLAFAALKSPTPGTSIGTGASVLEKPSRVPSISDWYTSTSPYLDVSSSSIPSSISSMISSPSYSPSSYLGSYEYSISSPGSPSSVSSIPSIVSSMISSPSSPSSPSPGSIAGLPLFGMPGIGFGPRFPDQTQWIYRQTGSFTRINPLRNFFFEKVKSPILGGKGMSATKSVQSMIGGTGKSMAGVEFIGMTGKIQGMIGSRGAKTQLQSLTPSSATVKSKKFKRLKEPKRKVINTMPVPDKRLSRMMVGM